MSTKNPLWRSLLYVPANNDRFIAKAHTRGADAVILDLEDSVPAGERRAARAALIENARTCGQSGADVVVRINRPLRDAVADLEAAIASEVRGLLITKTEGADHLRLLAEVVGALETERGLEPGHTCFVPMIETPAALARAHEIAGGCARNVALVLGGEDFAMEMGMVPDEETLQMPKLQCLQAARAAGLVPLGFLGTVADYGDREAFRRTVQRSKKFGFEGASVIHPGVVDVLNDEFAPSQAEVDWAERVVAAYDEAVASGTGAITVDGKMVDVPVAVRAERLLARHREIELKASRRG